MIFTVQVELAGIIPPVIVNVLYGGTAGRNVTFPPAQVVTAAPVYSRLLLGAIGSVSVRVATVKSEFVELVNVMVNSLLLPA